MIDRIKARIAEINKEMESPSKIGYSKYAELEVRKDELMQLLTLEQKVVKIAEIEQTCFAYPSSWSGTTIDNKNIYIRYRWGYLSVKVGGEEIFGITYGGELDGMIDLSTVLELTKGVLE